MSATARPHPWLLRGLMLVALTSAVVSSLGMLLVPTVAHAVDVPVSTAQWMLTVNLLVGAVATPVMGRLGDGPHKKALLVGSLAVVALGSVVAAVATTFWVLLLGRALQGLSYGIVPVTIAMARRHLSGREMVRGIAALSVTVSTGVGIGYPLTSVLASWFNFRAAFVFGALFSLLALAVAVLVLPRGRDEQAPSRPFDVRGTLLFAVGMSALLLGVGEGTGWGWTSPRTLGALLVALFVLAVWALVELRTEHPLVDLRVVRTPEVLLANLTAVGLGAAMYLSLSISSLVVQAPASTGYGIDLPLFWAGFVMLPFAVGSLGANRISALFAHKVSTAALLPIGAATMAVGALWLWLSHDRLWELLLGMLLFGIGIGTSYAAMPTLISSSVAAHELGSAVSFNQLLRTVGGAVGSAGAGAVLAAHMTPAHYPDGGGISGALALGSGVAVVVCVALTLNHLRGRGEDATA